MVKAVALSTVHVCKQPGEKNAEGRVTKKAVVDVVRPGQIFEADEKSFKELEASGSVRTATRADGSRHPKL